MPDVLTPEQRRLNMSRIKGKNTSPELLVRKALHARGFRYRLHDRNLPGKPDLVFPKFKAVLFIHGCFWLYRCCTGKTGVQR
jgi:DNA mismatch endonuclease, patch repair protein